MYTQRHIDTRVGARTLRLSGWLADPTHQWPDYKKRREEKPPLQFLSVCQPGPAMPTSRELTQPGFQVHSLFLAWFLASVYFSLFLSLSLLALFLRHRFVRSLCCHSHATLDQVPRVVRMRGGCAPVSPSPSSSTSFLAFHKDSHSRSSSLAFHSRLCPFEATHTRVPVL